MILFITASFSQLLINNARSKNGELTKNRQMSFKFASLFRFKSLKTANIFQPVLLCCFFQFPRKGIILPFGGILPSHHETWHITILNPSFSLPPYFQETAPETRTLRQVCAYFQNKISWTLDSIHRTRQLFRLLCSFRQK